MDDLENEEIEFIISILSQLSFKAGASEQMALVERILAKISKNEGEM